ncbi:MAG: c-type cytochrome [Hyphomonadaceae bacterium]
MGVHPERAAAHLDDARDVFAFLRDYQAPPFPGAIDRARAQRGRAVYASACASCHGDYDDSVERPTLTSFPNWIGPYDTDPARAQSFDQAVADEVERSGYGDRLQARATHAYAAPPLAGLWITAPYLHNGSAPTLWHLMHPSERPQRFMVGGHRLDFARVGIDGVEDGDGGYVYRAGYEPWSRPAVIDTTQRGLSNVGHAAEFEALTEAQKRDLLEYLKLL